MLDTSQRGADRASRLARATALTGSSGKVFPADSRVSAHSTSLT